VQAGAGSALRASPRRPAPYPTHNGLLSGYYYNTSSGTALHPEKAAHYSQQPGSASGLRSGPCLGPWSGPGSSPGYGPGYGRGMVTTFLKNSINTIIKFYLKVPPKMSVANNLNIK
jgi:hypothetical protein